MLYTHTGSIVGLLLKIHQYFRIVFWKNIQNCLTGYLALQFNLLQIKHSLDSLRFMFQYNYSPTHNPINQYFLFLVNTDWQSPHVIHIRETTVIVYNHFNNRISGHNNISINVCLYLIVNTILDLSEFEIFV